MYLGMMNKRKLYYQDCGDKNLKVVLNNASWVLCVVAAKSVNRDGLEEKLNYFLSKKPCWITTGGPKAISIHDFIDAKTRGQKYFDKVITDFDTILKGALRNSIYLTENSKKIITKQVFLDVSKGKPIGGSNFKKLLREMKKECFLKRGNK